jgi:hypothetical protein
MRCIARSHRVVGAARGTLHVTQRRRTRCTRTVCGGSRSGSTRYWRVLSLLSHTDRCSHCPPAPRSKGRSNLHAAWEDARCSGSQWYQGTCGLNTPQVAEDRE